MAREPELSIKVKVDPQVDAVKLKKSVERQIKNSQQIPEIEIKPDKEKLVENVKAALKDLEVPIAPKIDAAKFSGDLQNEIDKIKDIPKIQIQVDVNDFSNELNKKLKDEVKQVNSQLSYYLKNLTSNRNGLEEVSKNLFGGKTQGSNFREIASNITAIEKSADKAATSLNGFDKLLSKTRGLNGANSTEKLLALFDNAREGILKLYDGVDNGNLDRFKENIKFITTDVSNLEKALSALYERIQSPDIMKSLGWNEKDIEKNLDTIEKFITNLSILPTQSDLKEDLEGVLSRIDTSFFDEFSSNAAEAAESISYVKEDLQTFIDLCNKTNFNFQSIKEPVIKTNYDKKLEKTSQSNTSGYFDVEHIQNYAAAYDKAMSGLANWQSKINEYKKEALQLEDKLVIKTNINSNILKKQAADLKTLLDGIDESKLNKVTVKNTKSSNSFSESNNFNNEKVDLKGKITVNLEDIKIPETPVQLRGNVNISVGDIHIPDSPIEIKAKIVGIENVTQESTNNTVSASPTVDNLKSEKIKLVKAATYNASIEAMDRYIQKMGDIGVSQELLIQWTDNLTRQLQDKKDIFKEVADYAEKYIKAVELQNRKQGSKSGSDINGVIGVRQITSASKQIGKLSAAVNTTCNKDLVTEFDELQKSFNTFVSNGDRSLNTFSEIESAIGKLQQKVSDFKKAQNDLEKNTHKVTEKTITSFNTMIKQVDSSMWSLKKRNKTDLPEYQEISTLSERLHSLQSLMSENIGADENEIIQKWADNYPDLVGKIKKLSEAYDSLRQAATKAGISINDISNEVVQQNALTQSQTRIANLQSQLHDYLEKFPKIKNSSLADSVKELQQALNSPNAYQQADKLGQKLANLKQKAKELGLETESLIDKFEKLFGTHFSTMITMAALHQMQNALRIVYQNVVDIDTAITELRKVSEYTGRSLEEYMDRAANQAQKLGVSISAYINSTADWKRLGYSDEDAENLATYSTLLKNVGDGIDDVNTSSSYLISTLQGFGLLADQAENVVNKIDAVANTQPVTANDLGEILTRSSAAMSAANNTLEETIALGTAANSVIQDADTVGTTLKSLSMYLRAAKTDAEAAGIEVDGMANSVSELRTELKSLTGVDIMLDSKNFKSTYQIMKELSQVWGNLSDVTQANVTEMIGGKRNANAVSAILNNFSVAESAMESAANSANVAWEENEKYLDSIQGRLAQLDASFQALSTDILSSDLVKSGVSFLTTVVKLIDKLVDLTGALPLGLGIGAFATQLGEPKMTGFMIVPSNTPGGDTEQACGAYYIECYSAREYLVKPTNMVA